FGYRAETVRFTAAWDSPEGAGTSWLALPAGPPAGLPWGGRSRTILCTVEALRCNPPRARNSASFTLPSDGNALLSWRTTQAIRSGKRLTGTGTFTSASSPSSSSRFSHDVIVDGASNKRRAVSAALQPEAALS